MTRRADTRPDILLGGRFWLSEIVPEESGWGSLKHSTRLNGSWQLSWSIPIVRDWRHPALVYGTSVDLYFGPACLWSGSLPEPNWDAGDFIALGACRQAENATAFDGSGNASTVPNTVIDAAIARGVLSWTRVGNFGTTSVGNPDNVGELVTVKSVLDAWAQANNSNWMVDEQRRLIIAPVDETTPDWYVVPGSGVLGSADDQRVDRVFARYIDSTTGLRTTASYPTVTPAGGIEGPIDITDRGAMTNAAATTIAQAEWSKLQGRSGWTNGLTLIGGQVTTPGDIDADLAFVRAGDTARLLGVLDVRGLAQNTDIVIGDTEYDWTDDECQVNPVGLSARDEESVLEQAKTLATDAMSMAGRSTENFQKGKVGIAAQTIAAGGAATANVVFAVPFAETPDIDVSIASTNGGTVPLVARADTDSNTGFRIVLYNVSASPTTTIGTTLVRWSARVA